MNSICRFIPVKDYSDSIKTVHFVYETEFRKMKQPFCHPIYYLHLVTRGNAVLTVDGRKFDLYRGCVFFSFPTDPYEISGSDDFEYVYISFMGVCVTRIFSNLGISVQSPVFYNFQNIIDFWFDSIRRLDSANSNLLTECVLLYTLSYIHGNEHENDENRNNKTEFELILEYVDKHYTDQDISLKKIAGIFSYTTKYFSYLFKKKMNLGFNDYINRLRSQHALKLIEGGMYYVGELSSMCGYSDPLYFSKVFKKRFGISPTDYIKKYYNN